MIFLSTLKMSSYIVRAPSHGKHRVTQSLPPSQLGNTKRSSTQPHVDIGYVKPGDKNALKELGESPYPVGKVVLKDNKNCSDLNVITNKYGGKATECCREPTKDGLCAPGCTMSDKSTGLHCVPLSEQRFDKDASAGCFRIQNGICLPISSDPTCGMRTPNTNQSKLVQNECRTGSCYPDNKTCEDALTIESKQADKSNKKHKLPTETILTMLIEQNGLKSACSSDSQLLFMSISNLEELINNKMSDYDKLIIKTLICGFAMQPPSADTLGKFPYAGQGPGKNPGLLSLIESGQLQCYPQLNNQGRCSPSSRYFVSGINANQEVLKLISMFLTKDGIKSIITSGGQLPLPFENDFKNVQSKFIDGEKLSVEELKVYRQSILNYILGMAYPCSVDASVRSLGDQFVTNLTKAMEKAPISKKSSGLSDAQVNAPAKIHTSNRPFNWNLFGVITGISVVFILLIIGFVFVHKSRNK